MTEDILPGFVVKTGWKLSEFIKILYCRTNPKSLGWPFILGQWHVVHHMVEWGESMSLTKFRFVSGHSWYYSSNYQSFFYNSPNFNSLLSVNVYDIYLVNYKDIFRLSIVAKVVAMVLSLHCVVIWDDMLFYVTVWLCSFSKKYDYRVSLPEMNWIWNPAFEALHLADRMTCLDVLWFSFNIFNIYHHKNTTHSTKQYGRLLLNMRINISKTH